MLERELRMIENEEIREGTKKIVEMHKDWIGSCPPSPSGKYHSHEDNIEEHIIDAMICAEEIAREFKIQGVERDILYSGVILHDIGRVKSTHLGEKSDGNWKYYTKTGWSQYNYGKKHPFDSNEIIKENPFHKSDEIRALVKCHMSHWYAYCPQPKTLLEYAICMADYFATKLPEMHEEMKRRRTK